jgi:hypothetical protein
VEINTPVWFCRVCRTCEICGEIAQNVQLAAVYPSKQELDASRQDFVTVVVAEMHPRRATYILILRSIVICLLWIVIVLLLYRYVLPILQGVSSRQRGD